MPARETFTDASPPMFVKSLLTRLLIILLSLIAPAAFSANWYIATNGVDSNPGTGGRAVCDPYKSPVGRRQGGHGFH